MLIDTACRKAVCPDDKQCLRLTDGGGLHCEVSPSGSKRWFSKFYPHGKESRLALGSYPVVSLTLARSASSREKRSMHTHCNSTRAFAMVPAGPTPTNG